MDKIDRARQHYDIAAEIAVKKRDYLNAGRIRLNIARMYKTMIRSGAGNKKRILERALAYSESALFDFQRFQGKVFDDEAYTNQLIRRLRSELAKEI